MMMGLEEGTVLSNGVHIPWIGLDSCSINHPKTVETGVLAAIEAGYRAIDTAASYQNERGIGNALSQSGIDRKHLFITAKLNSTSHGYNNTLAAFNESRKKLGVDYIDLYMIQWPVRGELEETWRALEILYNRGEVRAIGVCNFEESDLKLIMRRSQLKPHVNQMEYHPLKPQKQLIHFCQQNQIQVQARNPYARGELFQKKVLLDIAEKHGKTPAQIAMKWGLQNGIPVVPAFSSIHEMRENMEMVSFLLPIEDMVNLHFLTNSRMAGPNTGHYFCE
ncbi:aldo/keto reductase family protein [Fictibacillus fluitans]|uniref:Aldo/keto reductase n=1 Tax=Fictibacillus fluitans TaxID=3058422 RepID=A0ABT8HUK5_9BACL|nr:aldo/keto reductase [Fictibacillus sp. NE201]MDN4524443.1 aldo/keto reductase [Fictibacillus sp. NE201]